MAGAYFRAGSGIEANEHEAQRHPEPAPLQEIRLVQKLGRLEVGEPPAKARLGRVGDPLQERVPNTSFPMTDAAGPAALSSNATVVGARGAGVTVPRTTFPWEADHIVPVAQGGHSRPREFSDALCLSLPQDRDGGMGAGALAAGGSRPPSARP